MIIWGWNSQIRDHHFIFTRHDQFFFFSEADGGFRFAQIRDQVEKEMFRSDRDASHADQDFLHAALTMHESAKTIHMMQPLVNLEMQNIDIIVWLILTTSHFALHFTHI